MGVSRSPIWPEQDVHWWNQVTCSLHCPSARFCWSAGTTCSPLIRFHGLTDQWFVETTWSSLCPRKSTEKRFPRIESVWTVVGGFYSANSSQENSVASFKARDQEPLGGISHAEDLAYNEGVSLGENSECSPERETAMSPEKLKLITSSAEKDSSKPKREVKALWRGRKCRRQDERLEGQDHRFQALLE